MNNFMNLDDAMVEEDWDRCFQYNVKCHLFLMHAVKSHLESTEGAFLVTSSTAGIKASGSSLVSTEAAQWLLADKLIKGVLCH